MDINRNNFYTEVTNSAKRKALIITWDTGKRCNFECIYCGPERSDRVSPYIPLEQLKAGVDFLDKYLDIVLPNRIINPEHPGTASSLSLTGGEPTISPDFIPFMEYLYEHLGKHSIKFGITSNCSWDDKILEYMLESQVHFVTASYHCDSRPAMKKRVMKNIISVHDFVKANPKIDKSIKVNHMMHPYDKYWEECIDVAQEFDKQGIPWIPRVIQGLEYSTEQKEWFSNYWKTGIVEDTRPIAARHLQRSVIKSAEIKTQQTKAEAETKTESETKKVSTSDKQKLEVFKKLMADRRKTQGLAGRNCCSKDPMTVKLQDGTSETLDYLKDVNFNNWYCSVNLFFIHLESQTDQIFHHQMCKVKFNSKQGAVSSISNHKEYIDTLKGYYDKGEMPAVKCPEMKCRCGVCANKSTNLDELNNSLKTFFKDLKYVENFNEV